MGAYAYDAREGAEYAKRMTRPDQKEKSLNETKQTNGRTNRRANE